MLFPKDFINKKILIYGYGLTGKSVKKYFDNYKLKYSIWDDNKKKKINSLEKNYYKKNYDFIVLSPGIDIYHHKKKFFFNRHKKKIITDLDIFFSSPKKNKYIIGVTGTNGKSSFCNLLKNILKKNKINSKIIGNFGNPVLNEKISNIKYYIIELSSYQLDYSKYVKINAACILNLSPDHLERHKTFANYKKVKLKIFKFLKKDGIGLYHKNSFKNLKKTKYLKYFSNINKELIQKLVKKKLLIRKKDFFENKLAHRNEFFLLKKNLKFINDSKSTNFDSTRYAIKKYRKIILILGGQLKRGDNFYIKDLKNRIYKIYLFGKKINKLKQSLKKQNINFEYHPHLRIILNNFYKKQYIDISDQKKTFTLLFSPGAASFDHFKNFEDRGEKFKKYIHDIFKR